MILPDYMIRDARGNDQDHIFEPWSERTVVRGLSHGLSAAGFDVRVGSIKDVPEADGVYTLAPGAFALAVTVERFSIPPYLLAIVHDKSTWARRGLAVQNTVAEPGWNGWLTLELKNEGADFLKIRSGDPIAQIIFHQMVTSPERAYSGKYQDQPAVPVPALLEGVE